MIEHIIFDCDGVLIDSEPLSMRVDVELLAEAGVAMSEEEAHRRFVGLTFEAMIETVEHEYAVKFPVGLLAEKDRRLLALYERELKSVPGIGRALSAMAHPASIASNSPRRRIIEALRITGLTSFFGANIITFEDVSRPKPEPDVFLEAARRAGVAPAKCLAIEDSATGVTAAHRAGCRVLGFTGSHGDPGAHGPRLLGLGAETVFSRMADLPGLVSSFVKHAQGKI